MSLITHTTRRVHAPTHTHHLHTHGRRAWHGLELGKRSHAIKPMKSKEHPSSIALFALQMSSHPRDDASGLKPAFPARRSDDFLEEELAARNICNRKHGCSVLLSVPDAFTTHICEHTVNYLAGQDLYIPSEVEHSKWYLEVYTSPS